MSHQIAYDLIGAGWALPHGGSLTSWSAAILKDAANPKANTTLMTWPGGHPSSFGVYFPVPHDLAGYSIRYTRQYDSYVPGTTTIYTSTDTTDGNDGTWTNHGAGQLGWNAFNHQTLAAPGIRGFKVTQIGPSAYNSYMQNLLLFGTPTVTDNPQSVVAWHPTLDEPVQEDYFQVATHPGGGEARQFRVKNLHDTLTANNVGLSTNVATDASPALGPEQEFEISGGGFAATLDIGNLAPGATSGVVTYRVMKDAGAALGTFYPRLVIQPGSWS